MIDIDKLLELESKATQGYWEFVRHNSGVRAWICNEDDYIFPAGDKDYYPADIANQDGELVCAMRNNIRPLLLELKAARKVIEAAKHHLNYAKEKENCGPCFDYCPNAIDGEADCECGGSMIWYSLKQLEGGEK